jgi:hypothetical protein
MTNPNPSADRGWYPDPAGSPRRRFWDGSQWTVHYEEPRRSFDPIAWFGHVRLWQFVLALAWFGAIGVASVAALWHRPAFAGVQADTWVFLVLFSIPPVALALVAIRTPVTFVAVALASGAWSAANSWTTMRDTHSTAALGLLATPVIATAIVCVGCVVDIAWRFAVRTARARP